MVMHTFNLNRGKQKQMDLWSLRDFKTGVGEMLGRHPRPFPCQTSAQHSPTFQLLFFTTYLEKDLSAVQTAHELILQVREALNFSSSLKDPLGSIIDLSHQGCLLFFPIGEENITPTSNDKKGSQFSLLSTDFLITTPWLPVLTLQTGKCSGVSQSTSLLQNQV